MNIQQTNTSLYQRFREGLGLTNEVRIANWLRVHFLLQAYQAICDQPCSVATLKELWLGRLHPLDVKAPAIVPLLASFSLWKMCELPLDLLEELCAVYENPSFPDLGSLYLMTQSAEQIKRKGQVFTPCEAVVHAFSLLKQPIDGRILDLSCGAGEFLLEAYRLLRDRYLAQGYSPAAAHQRILLEHLYGVDIDPWAVILTRCRLFLECPAATCLANNIVTLDAHHIFNHPLGKRSYHLIVGNPPWGATKVTKCTANSFATFLETSIRLLAPESQFSLLIPATFLNAKCYQPLRQLLLLTTEIDVIEYAPALFRRRYAPAVFLAGRRATSPDPAHHIEINRGTPNWSCWQSSALSRSKSTTLVPQRAFVASTSNTFNIHYDPHMEHICTFLQQNTFTLHPDALPLPPNPDRPVALVKFVLGIITGNNRVSIRYMPDRPDSEPIFSADDVEPFRLRSPIRHIVYDKHHLQQAAPAHCYKASEKLLYKFISKEICTAIDHSGTYTLNNLNCILPTELPPHVSLRYIAALLNSQLLNTYYLYKCFTAKVTVHNLCAIPLKLPTPEEAQRIEELVLAIESDRQDLIPTLNDAIYCLYDIPPSVQSFLAAKHAELHSLPFV